MQSFSVLLSLYHNGECIIPAPKSGECLCTNTIAYRGDLVEDGPLSEELACGCKRVHGSVILN